MASLDLNSWPRMRAGFENPFQNAPGRFIPALPNLAGLGRSISPDAISDPSFACPFSPFDDEHYRRQSRYCHNRPEAPPNSPLEGVTVETAGPLTEDADHPEDLPLDGDNDSDSDDTSSSQHPQEQQSSSGSSTLTPSHSHTPSSPTSSESFEDQDQEEEELEEDGEDSPKVEGRRRKRKSGQGARRKRRNRQFAQQNGCVMGPRAMGIPGVQIQVWLQRSQQQQQHQPLHPAQAHSHLHSRQLAPPWLPSAMPGVGHAHVLFPAPAYCGFAASSSSPTTWLLPPSSHAVPPIPGFFVG